MWLDLFINFLFTLLFFNSLYFVCGPYNNYSIFFSLVDNCLQLNIFLFICDKEFLILIILLCYNLDWKFQKNKINNVWAQYIFIIINLTALFFCFFFAVMLLDLKKSTYKWVIVSTIFKRLYFVCWIHFLEYNITIFWG